MNIYKRILANADSTTSTAVGKASGTAAIGGAGVATVADKASALGLSEIASIVAIIGSLVWTSKNLFDWWLSYLKHKNDGFKFPPWYQNPFTWLAAITAIAAAHFFV